jgi:hypothetical protein
MTADYQAARALRQEKIRDAVRRGDVAAFVRATHPKLLKAFREAYIASGDAEKFMAQWKSAKGIK